MASMASSPSYSPPEASSSSPSSSPSSCSPPPLSLPPISYVPYTSERYLPLLHRLISVDLSEPYSIFTYRYFVNSWPDLTLMAMVDRREWEGWMEKAREEKEKKKEKEKAHEEEKKDEGDEKEGAAGASSLSPSSPSSPSSPNSVDSLTVCVGCIVCRLTRDSHGNLRGYIGMLAVSPPFRGRGLGSSLVSLALQRMKERGGDLCVLETEVVNGGALALYEKKGFVREARLSRYYLNGGDAFRLKYWFTTPAERRERKEKEGWKGNNNEWEEGEDDN